MVLLVDDDKDHLYLAERRLTALGFGAICATDGLGALLAMVDYPDCHCMVTDYHMPGLGGDEWIRILERFCADWRIVVISGGDPDPGPFLSMPKPADFTNIATFLHPTEE